MTLLGLRSEDSNLPVKDSYGFYHNKLKLSLAATQRLGNEEQLWQQRATVVFIHLIMQENLNSVFCFDVFCLHL